MKDIRQHILDEVADLAANFLYYDRKEDEELPRGAIEEAVRDGGLITVEEIVEEFAKNVRAA